MSPTQNVLFYYLLTLYIKNVNPVSPGSIYTKMWHEYLNEFLWLVYEVQVRKTVLFLYALCCKEKLKSAKMYIITINRNFDFQY